MDDYAYPYNSVELSTTGNFAGATYYWRPAALPKRTALDDIAEAFQDLAQAVLDLEALLRG